ncbi:KCNH2, partial [Symbiodinium sp. CCMP2456]
MLKLRTLMANFHDLINSEYWSLVANMSQIVTFMLGINHLVACGFYGLTELTQASEETSWVRSFGFEGTSWSYRYATALHWSITQFTPAAMEVHPTNMSERSYSIAVVIFAMVGFSSLVGGITSILTQLRGLSQEKAKELWKLRRYMRLKHVKADLNVRIQRYVEHAWNERQMNLSIGSVKFVELLSEPLRDELLCAVDMPTMVVHPLFSFLQKEQEVTLRRLVTHAIQHKFLARGDIHFYSAEVATHAYFTVSGNQTYTQHPPRVAVAVAVEIDRNQQWVGEQVLWANDWVHLGSFQAVSESDMMALDPAEVAKALSSNPPAWNAVAGYAQEFTMWLNSQHTNELSDVLSA